MSFVEQFKEMDWDSITLSIYSKTTRDVERALAKPKLDLDDFKALISPAAEPYLEQMAQRSMQKTRQRLVIQFLCTYLYTYPICVRMLVLIAGSPWRTRLSGKP